MNEIPETASPPLSPDYKAAERTGLLNGNESGELGGNFSEYRGVHLESSAALQDLQGL
jgi:hypothetical protein